ncbi:MAG: alkaline phosphatase [Candidatus Methylomirabilaceae bacterium]
MKDYTIRNRASWPLLAVVAALSTNAGAAPSVSRLTPPSELFSSGNSNPPIIARFFVGQKFDLQATVRPDAGQSVAGFQFAVDGKPVAPAPGASSIVTAGLVGGLPANTAVVSVRGYKNRKRGVHTLTVTATQSDGQTVTATGNFEVVGYRFAGPRAKNVIIMLGDGMGSGHRTAARIMQFGIAQGKPKGRLAMDTFPVTASIMTPSLNSIVTDSAPGMQNYVTGNKANNNQEGVFPDDTTANFDNPRVEYMAEYLARTQRKKLGIVTTADVFDATPASMAIHTQSRGAGTGIVDQYFDDRAKTGLTVLMGGGRKWFLPNPTNCPAAGCGSASGFNGSARGISTDYTLPADIVAGWGSAPGALDPGRDLIADFQAAGWNYAHDTASMSAAGPGPLLGLFSLSNMNIALDKINKRRGTSTVVDDYGFPDQPLLEEMTAKALEVLDAKSPRGFVLLVEAASIDKQAHSMDTERWILDTIEFDKSIAVAQQYAKENPDTLVLITADHECAGVAVIGGSRVTDADLQLRIATGQGASQVRNGVVGTYESAGFPQYPISATDGYPSDTDPDKKMLIGYAANADRYEDWRTNPQPLRDSQQPGNNVAPLDTYPSGPLNRDTTGNFLVTGQIADVVAAHTANDIPLSACGRGASLLRGTMDNTDVFFAMMRATVGGWPNAWTRCK